MPCVVGDEDAAGPGIHSAPKHCEHEFAGRAVERTGWLIGEDDAPGADDRACDRDPLLLAAGEVIRIVIGAIGQVNGTEGVQGGGPRLALLSAIEFEGECNILDRGEGGDQVEVLKHEAEGAAAQGGNRLR